MRSTIVLGLALLSAATCPAAVILSNLAAPAQGSFTLNSNLDLSLAAELTMGSESFSLTEAQVEFATVGISSYSPSVVLADLYADVGDNPGGASLLSFTVTAPGNVIQNNIGTLTPASSFILQANTSYWLVLHTTADLGNTGNLGWAGAGATPPTGPFATSGGFRRGGGVPPNNNLGQANFIYEIDGEPFAPGLVPEPGTSVLFALGSVGLLIARRFRRHTL